MKTPSNVGIFSAKDGLDRPRFWRRNRDSGHEGPLQSPPLANSSRRINWLKSGRVFSLSVLVTCLSGFAVPSFAEDIELYHTAKPTKPNILFMLDNSKSMGFADDGSENPAPGQSRIEILRDAIDSMSTAIADNNSANVGVGRFTQKEYNANANKHYGSNAPIVFKVGTLSSDEDFSITLSTSSTIMQTADDAMENVETEVMNLTSPTLLVPSDSENTLEMTVGSSTYTITLSRTKSGNTWTWKYHVDKTSNGNGELDSWILGIAGSCDVTNPTEPQHTALQTDRSKGLGWDVSNGFTAGDFEFTLDQDYPETLVDVFTNGADTAIGQIGGPNCITGGGGSSSTAVTGDGMSTIIVEGNSQYKVSFVSAVENENSGTVTWTYKAETLDDTDGSLARWHLTNLDANAKWKCHTKAKELDTITDYGDTYTNGNPFGLWWSTGTGWVSGDEVSFTLPKYPVGYIDAWGSQQSTSPPVEKGNSPIFGPLCNEGGFADVAAVCTLQSEAGCSNYDTVSFEVSLHSFANNSWHYKVKNASGTNPAGVWKFGGIPQSCFSKISEISKVGNVQGEKINSSRRIQWEIPADFDELDFSFTLDLGDSATGTLSFNNNALATRIGGGFELGEAPWSNSPQVLGPGNCEAEILEEHAPATCELKNSGKKNEKMTICHIPHGNPGNAHTIEISKKAWPAHFEAGDLVGACPSEDQFVTGLDDGNGNVDEAGWALLQDDADSNDNEKKVTICHTAKGKNPHEITINKSALKTHLDHHMDTLGACPPADLPELICPESEAEPQLVGLRFNHVDVPKGATITSAKIYVTSAITVGSDEDPATWVINAQASDNAPSFNTTPKNISERPVLSGKEITWTENRSWWDGENAVFDTPELSGLVQELVKRDGWCGGNSLAFIIKGDENGSLRRIWSYDGHPSRAPRLEVHYSTTKNAATSCMKQSYFKQIAEQNDDAEETSQNNGQMFLTTTGNTLELGWGNNENDTRTVGLRFTDLPIRKDAQIEKAYLILQARSDGSGDADFEIQGELSPNSEPFSEQNSELTNRTKITGPGTTVDWAITEPWQADLLYQSPDLAAIVQQMVAQDGWNENDNSMSFFITGTQGRREAFSFEEAQKAARLHIQVNGYLKEITLLDQFKDKLKKTITPTGALGNTPLVDALYEAAMYYRSGLVTYGKDREYQKTYLVSAPDTYTHEPPLPEGTPKVNTPDGCNVEVDPFDPACHMEKITEIANGPTPYYDSPISDPCQTSNHIVLLTEGEASRNESKSKIIDLIGDEYLIQGNCQSQWETSWETSEGDYTFDETTVSSDPSKLQAAKDNCDNGNCEVCGVSLAKFLFENDHYDDPDSQTDDGIKNNITTHTVGFLLDSNNAALSHAADYLRVMAEQGGGNSYVVEDVNTLTQTMIGIVEDIVKDTSSFAAGGVSVNRFNPLVHNNEVYYALYKQTNQRSWDGNVKKYKLASVSVSGGDATQQCNRSNFVEGPSSGEGSSGDNALCLVDQDGKPAFEDENISEKAKSFWSDDVDGANITEGGAGDELLAIVNERQILTYVGSSPTTPTNLSPLADADLVAGGLTEITSDLTDEVLASLHLTKAEVQNYSGDLPITINDQVDWIRGTKRTWLMADPMHSTPQAISYAPPNDDGAPNVKVFVGTNDGLVRMLDGGTGQEQWAFLPQELLDRQAALMINSADPDLTKHIYGMDGSPAFWIHDGDNRIDPNDGDFVKMFMGQRRGGRHLYALDVTGESGSYGSAPQLMWSISGGEGEFVNLGETWSFPRAVSVHPSYCEVAGVLPENGKCVALFFGGGYDADQTLSADSSQKGNAIYLVHADTGKRLWWASSDDTTAECQLADMKQAIPSDLKILDIDGDGQKDRAYVGDVAGRLWRVDLKGWQKNVENQYEDLTLCGRLANISSAGAENQRRFFYPPDWTTTLEGLDVVVIGSGTRPFPTSRDVADRLYVFFDQGWVPNIDQEQVLTTITESNLWEIGTERLNDTKGWYLKLPNDGEKSLGSPVIVQDKQAVLFTTYTPPPPPAEGECQPGAGVSRLYALDLYSGNSAFKKLEVDTEEQSIVIGEGLISDIQLVVGENPNDKERPRSILKPNMPVADMPGPQRVFWLQVD